MAQTYDPAYPVCLQLYGAKVTTSIAATHLVAVADLRMTGPTALQLRDLLDKALLAMRPIPGAAN